MITLEGRTVVRLLKSKVVSGARLDRFLDSSDGLVILIQIGRLVYFCASWNPVILFPGGKIRCDDW
jgi:hypothetical protein